MGEPITGPRLAADIARLYTEGLGAVEVAKRLSVGSSTVYRVLARHGIPVRAGSDTHRHLRKLNDDQIKEVVSAYQSGISLNQLADRYRMSVKGIHYILKHHGVVLRSRGNVLKSFSENEIVQMRSVYEEGVSQKDLAKLFGVGHAQIQRFVRTHKGERHPHWKGGRIVTEQGYVRVRLPSDHVFASMLDQGGYVFEHRLIMATMLGRPLRGDETVHHKDGNGLNNSHGNLQLRLGQHGKGVAYQCRSCGSCDLVPVELGGPSK